jgi:hypothetical protein
MEQKQIEINLKENRSQMCGKIYIGSKLIAKK